MFSAGVAPIAPLTRDHSSRLVELSLAAALVHGFDVTYDGGAALVSADSSGPVLGLSNLARAVAQYDNDAWPGLINEHFARMGEQLRQGPPPPPGDPASQLIPREALPADWTADRPDFLPGLVAVPSAVKDNSVTMYLNAEDLGITQSDADGFGLVNLRKLPLDVEHEERDGVRISFLTGTSYAASKALVLDTVLRDVLHLGTPQHGVLVALPARAVLMIHVIEDLSVIPALGRLLNLAASFHATDQGPLTRDVYWVTADQTWHPATVAFPDRVSLRLSGHVEALTRDLAQREESGR